ncbi:hypothetical protein MHBO_002312 [Bonamia ostreae]|uniref:NADH dehydrogenase subunit 4L n=1 Tax=Bonamia ostreae TaxID=126728 RepID=A0ABV2ALX3_9EUKA
MPDIPKLIYGINILVHVIKVGIEMIFLFYINKLGYDFQEKVSNMSIFMMSVCLLIFIDAALFVLALFFIWFKKILIFGYISISIIILMSVEIMLVVEIGLNSEIEFNLFYLCASCIFIDCVSIFILMATLKENKNKIYY